MRPLAFVVWCRTVLACLALIGVGIGVVQAQQPTQQGSEGPRFLVAVAGQRSPVAADPARIPLLASRVTLTVKDVPLTQALALIGRQADIAFVYGPDVVRSNRRVNVQVHRLTLAAALTEVLFGAGVDVLVSDRRQVTLVPRSGAKDSEDGSLTGRVTDAKSGQGISSTEVLLQGTSWRTATDTAGWYHLTGIAAGTYRLMVRRLGYAKVSREVTVRAAQEDTVNLVLEPLAVTLDELVTTATGQQRRRDLGNAITTIRADSVMQAAPIRNLTDLLENRVPGLTAQHTSGAPGDPTRIRLRGLGSVFRSNDPVVIVDGVRVYASQSESRSGNLTNLGQVRRGNGADFAAVNATKLPAPSPLDQIDPNIIEKIEVFKGPSAATLYGADAANGVIVVTTKKGAPGPVRWNATASRGRTDTPGRWPEGYYRWGHSPVHGGGAIICRLTEITCIQDSLVRFQALNDPNLTVLGRGDRTALSLTASGGSQSLTYSVTGSYSDEVGLLKLPAFEAERFQARFNRAAPDWMARPHHYETWGVTSNVRALLGRSADVVLTTMLSRSEQQRSSLENSALTLAGVYLDTENELVYEEVGNVAPYTATHFADKVIFAEYYKKTTASAINFTTKIGANWSPRSWLRFSSQAGVNVIPRDDQFLVSPGYLTGTPGLPVGADSGVLIRGTGRSLVSTFNLQGQVRRPLGWGFAFETSVGGNINTTSTSDLITSAWGLVPGTSTIAGARTVTGTESRVNTSSFGWYIEPRITGQRISLSTGLRLDGGSAYGARVTQTGGVGNLLSLPKLNGSWVVSEEPWFPFNTLFSSLRLRGAYGQAQVQPGPTDRLRLYGGRADQILKLTSVGNTQLVPERSIEFEGGFDADLLDSRMSLELTAYRKTQVDALMPVQLPPSVNGSGTVIRNIGNIRNQGLELTLGITPVQLPALTWSAQLNYSRNSNTLVRLGRGVTESKSQGLVAGYPVGARWARPILGYADANGNGILERQEVQMGDSLVYMGRLLPAYTTSLFTNVALFGGAVGVTAGFSYDAGATQIDQMAVGMPVLSRALFDPTAPLSEQAALLVRDSTEYGVTHDVSTFRFSSFSVNYRAPLGVARWLRAQRLTVGIQGSNLGLHSNYRGKDPNVSSWSPTENIRDTGQLPVPRTWQLSFSLEY